MAVNEDAELPSLDELDDYLMSDEAPEDSMMICDLDGFLTAIAIGPEFIKPSEWFPMIWRGGQPNFASEQQMERIFAAIFGRYNEIVDDVANDPDFFQPILLEHRETGEVHAADWVDGFIEGMNLRPDGWGALARSSEAKLLEPFAAFEVFAESPALEGLVDEGRAEELREHAHELIPESVIGIDRFFRGTRAFFDNGA